MSRSDENYGNEKHSGKDGNYGKAWYSLPGNERDVIISSRVRLSRNLANFPFPERFKNDDDDRVKSIILDAFQKVENPEHFHSISVPLLSFLNRKVLEERGVLKTKEEEVSARKIHEESGVVLNRDGDISSAINGTDHIKISSFSSGLAFRRCFENAKRLDDSLQESLQFAASYDFGYLSSMMKDTGSGMKISARICIPAVLKTGNFKNVADFIREKKCVMLPAFPSISKGNIPPAGSYFLVHNGNSRNGTEIDQIAEMESVCKFIAEYERKILADFADNHITVIRNSVLRSFSVSRMSLLVSLREAVDMISDIQTGLRLGLVGGIDNDSLCGLLYRVQDGHLLYLMENGDFDFEDDVKENQILKLDRLRAVTLQEAFENISLRKL